MSVIPDSPALTLERSTPIDTNTSVQDPSNRGTGKPGGLPIGALLRGAGLIITGLAAGHSRNQSDAGDGSASPSDTSGGTGSGTGGGTSGNNTSGNNGGSGADDLTRLSDLFKNMFGQGVTLPAPGQPTLVPSGSGSASSSGGTILLVLVAGGAIAWYFLRKKKAE